MNASMVQIHVVRMQSARILSPGINARAILGIQATGISARRNQQVSFHIHLKIYTEIKLKAEIIY